MKTVALNYWIATLHAAAHCKSKKPDMLSGFLLTFAA